MWSKLPYWIKMLDNVTMGRTEHYSQTVRLTNYWNKNGSSKQDIAMSRN